MQKSRAVPCLKQGSPCLKQGDNSHFPGSSHVAIQARVHFSATHRDDTPVASRTWQIITRLLARQALLALKKGAQLHLYTISIARPPSTNDGRTMTCSAGASALNTPNGLGQQAHQGKRAQGRRTRVRCENASRRSAEEHGPLLCGSGLRSSFTADY